MITLRSYQQDAVEALLNGKHIVVASCGVGKGFISLEWARGTKKSNVLVITQASKVKSNDFVEEAKLLDEKWYNSQSSFTVVSWNSLAKWLKEHQSENFADYAIIADEIQRIKNYSTGMGKSFLKIASHTKCWAGFTATPGESWIQMMPYFVACGFVKHKTDFTNKFCVTQSFKGYIEIIGYNHEEVLNKWWSGITYFPDTKEMEKQLPSETHKVVHFKAPTGYAKVLKTKTRLDTDEFIDTSMAMCHYLRQLCCSKEKVEWLKEFVESLDTSCVVFYTYIEEGEKIKEALKGVKIWEINGKKHDIPTADTIGKHDVVLAQWESGSASLNLQFMNYWVSFSPCYSLTTSCQSRGRIKRIGQTKPMFYYYLKTDHTIENDIYKALKEKRDFSETVWYENKFGDGDSKTVIK